MVYADRVQESATTTGTGSLTLAGAVSGFVAFATAYAVGDAVNYAISGGADWEVGVGTLSASSTLTRDTVFSSSNSGALVSLAAGTKSVFATVPARAVVDAGLSYAASRGCLGV